MQPYSKFCLWYLGASVVRSAVTWPLRTGIACQLPMLWLLVKFLLPYIFHSDGKELNLISPVSSLTWCTARRCLKDAIKAKTSSSSFKCTYPLGLDAASSSFLQHQPGPTIHLSPEVQTQWPQQIMQHTDFSRLQSRVQVTECLSTILHWYLSIQLSERNKSSHLHLNKLCYPFPVSRYLPVYSMPWYFPVGTFPSTWDFLTKQDFKFPTVKLS